MVFNTTAHWNPSCWVLIVVWIWAGRGTSGSLNLTLPLCIPESASLCGSLTADVTGVKCIHLLALTSCRRANRDRQHTQTHSFPSVSSVTDTSKTFFIFFILPLSFTFCSLTLLIACPFHHHSVSLFKPFCYSNILCANSVRWKKQTVSLHHFCPLSPESWNAFINLFLKCVL